MFSCRNGICIAEQADERIAVWTLMKQEGSVEWWPAVRTTWEPGAPGHLTLGIAGMADSARSCCAGWRYRRRSRSAWCPERFDSTTKHCEPQRGRRTWSAPRPEAAGRSDRHRRPFESSVGLKILVPGGRISRGGSEHAAAVLAESFGVALLAGFWAWGTWLGWGILAFAFITHVTAVTRCITSELRSRSFPVVTALTFVASGARLLAIHAIVVVPVADRMARIRARWQR